jgi:hypothetical protein
VSAVETIRVPVDYPTIQAAIDAAQDGDVVLVSPGTYRERLDIRGKSITLASEFLTTGDQSAIDTTVLEPPGGPEAITILSPATEPTRIVGLTMANEGGQEMDGIKAFTRAEILNNRLVGFVDALDIEPSHTGPATPFVVRDNVIENSVDDAVDLDGPTTAEVEDNVLRDSREDGIEIRFHEFAGRLDIVIRGNTITGSRGDGIQLIDVGGTSDRFLTIERNIISATKAGLGLMDKADSTEDYRAASLLDEIHLLNNTFIGNDHAVSGGDNLVAVNNLFVNSTTLGLKGVDGNSVASHNLFWGNGRDALNSNVDAATTIAANPLLGPDYTLGADSPAIDAGAAFFTWRGRTVLNLPPDAYWGDGPDLGARERRTLETTITSGPSHPSDSASASFGFASSDPDSTFECALDGAPYQPCSSPKAYGGLADGRHTFLVRATDAAGNVDPSPASSTWTVAIPVTVTLAPAADARVEQTQPGTNYGTATSLGADTSPRRESYLRFTVSGLTRTVRSAKLRLFDFNGTEDGPALYEADGSWSESAITWNTKPAAAGGVIDDKGANGTSTWVEYDVGSVVRGNGTYNFNLVPTSSDGSDYNSREAAARRPELVLTLGADLTAPETTIVSGPAGSVGSGSAGFVFSATEPGSTFECALDGSAFAACSSPRGFTGLAEGAHTFEVRATDPAGNADETPASRTWRVDTTQPVTSIDSGPMGSVGSASAAFTFSSDEQDAGFECALDGAAFAVCSSPQSYAGLAEGAHTFEVRAMDGAGNSDSTPATRTWRVDTIAPETAIVSGPMGSVGSPSAAFAFSSDEQGAGFECALDGAAFAACGSPQSYAGLAEGVHTFHVRATDGAGNTDPTPATRTWTVDAPSTFVTVTAEADARVERGNPSTNYGSSSSLVSDLSPQTESYLRFTVAGVTGTVKSAKLRLWVTSETGNGPALYAAENMWTEGGVTWNKKPARTGGIIDNKGSVGSDRWVEYNVLAVAAANGTYTFNLVPESSDGLAARSREASSNRPHLILEVDES